MSDYAKTILRVYTYTAVSKWPLSSPLKQFFIFQDPKEIILGCGSVCPQTFDLSLRHHDALALMSRIRSMVSPDKKTGQ